MEARSGNESLILEQIGGKIAIVSAQDRRIGAPGFKPGLQTRDGPGTGGFFGLPRPQWHHK